MTEKTDDPTTEASSSTDDTEDGSRTRTRTRSRKATDAASGGRRRRASSSDDASDDAPQDASDDTSGERAAGKDAGDGGSGADGGASGEDDGGGSGGRRRGRRGRRGRGGRGRGDGGGDRSGSGGGGGRAKGGDGGDGGTSPDDDAATDGDEETEQAIARGGTRMAAKRGRRSGGASRGGGRSGGRDQRVTGVSEEVRRAILDGPPRTMLVSSQEDRTQIAVLEDRTVAEHYVTRKEDVTYVGNIYMARVQNVLPGMEAAFLDIGKGRNGVLYAGEVLYDELDVEEAGENPRIQDVLKQGQKVLVQVTKDPMGTKGPRLTMHLSLAGRYMVLAPNSDLFGISRKLTDRERDRLRKAVKKVKPDHHGVIVRTAAENATEDQLIADLERLLRKWEKVEERAKDAKALTTVYEEPPLVVKVIRDNFGPEFERCVVDSEELHAQVRDYLDEVAPELLDKVELYGAPGTAAPAADDETPEEAAPEDAAAEGDDAGTAEKTKKGKGGKSKGKAAKGKAEPAVDEGERPPLFEAYNVNEQLRKAMGRKVWLPSGGYLIIESTEAMKVIDVNTGKFTGDAKSNLEEVVLKTNLEAAEEIVRQLRLRDLGGIIIIDFIDMLLKTNQDQVVRRLKRELLRDRTKTRVSEVSRLGLVQMTRKNVSQGLVEVFSHRCDQCEGRGYISDLGD